MNMTQEMLEILIGKYIDGEIASGEEQILQEAMEADPGARELLEQLQVLHQRSEEVISSELLEKGRDAEEIFESALKHRTKNPLRRVIGVSGRLRFITGLAAGLIIGLTIHFALPVRSLPENEPVPQQLIAQKDTDEPVLKTESGQSSPSDRAPKVFRNVDWYSFTDKDGDYWIVEGLRENVIRPAAYNADL